MGQGWENYALTGIAPGVGGPGQAMGLDSFGMGQQGFSNSAEMTKIGSEAALDPMATARGEGRLAEALGLTGAQGEYYIPKEDQGMALLQREADDATQRQQAQSSGAAQDARAQYLGSGDLGAALSQGRQMGGAGYSQFVRDLAVDPLSGSALATQQVQNNPILGQVFGQGGSFDRINKEEQDLASRGYQIQPEDVEAYGQASGNIARQSGQQEQALARSLAARGLSGAPSGAAVKGYSGIGGNKFERLAQAQTDIAQKRMQSNMDRLNQTRSMMTNLTQQGRGAIDEQYGRQQTGVNSLRADSASRGQLGSALSSAHNANEQLRLKSLEDKRGAKGQTLGQSLGRGTASATEAAPSMVAKAAMA